VAVSAVSVIAVGFLQGTGPPGFWGAGFPYRRQDSGELVGESDGGLVVTSQAFEVEGPELDGVWV